jgi:type II restriction enzyme
MMNLRMDPSCASGLKSKCQVARRVTEAWGRENLFCSSCDSDSVQSTRHNTQAVDFICPDCRAAFQLKASLVWNEKRVPDAGYHAMMRALGSDSVPNLLVMQYSADWHVHNLIIVPSFFFTSAAIEKRKPLAPTARRAGWIGCNILLKEIADIGKIRVVSNGKPAEASFVRSQYSSVRPLANLEIGVRGWTLDVLRLVKRLGQRYFSIKDAYQFAPELSKLHPKNKNVQPKIRQQLQVLRDLGFVGFLSRGEYELLK